MLTTWTTPLIEAKDEYISWLIGQDYPSYQGLLRQAIEIIARDGEFGYGDKPDPARIVRIDHGEYQGTLVFVIGASGYQPDNYWSVMVGYGSCSGCDSIAAARGYANGHDYEALWNLALHMIQGARRLG